MSFSSEAKNELCRLQGMKTCCMLAEVYGALLFCGVFSHQEIRVSTEYEAIAMRLSMLLSCAFDVDVAMRSVGRKFSLHIQEQRELQRIFSKLGYDFKCYISYHINRNMVENECCAAAFLRGVFLMSGTVASPDKKCHLEIKSTHRSLCREVMSLMLDIGMAPKCMERGSTAIVYFKDTVRVEDFLTLIGASRAAMRIMEAKVEKELRNAINRQVNCETANIVKASDASVRQVTAMQSVLARGGEEAFPEELLKTVHLRLENPTASLAELAALHTPPISKPGLSHRMKRIMELAQTLQLEGKA